MMYLVLKNCLCVLGAPCLTLKKQMVRFYVNTVAALVSLRDK